MKKDWPAHSALLSRVKGHFSPFSQVIPRSLDSNDFPCALCYYWNESSILQWSKIENNQGSWRVACYMLKWYVFGTLEIKKEGYQIDPELLSTGHNCFVSTDVPCSVIMAECDDHGWVSKSFFESSAFSGKIHYCIYILFINTGITRKVISLIKFAVISHPNHTDAVFLLQRRKRNRGKEVRLRH